MPRAKRNPIRSACFKLSVGAFALSAMFAAAAERNGDAYHWFSVPIEVTGLGSNSGFVPISHQINLSSLLQALPVKGAVDERSLRLSEVGADGAAHQIPYQFSPDPQPRLRKRTLLPGTSDKVSYVRELPAGETPEGVHVSGELSWIVREPGVSTAIRATDANTVSRRNYRLDFGVPKTGRLIQVPFDPANLRAFDDSGAATALPWFPRMQIRPQWPLEGFVNISENAGLITTWHLGPWLRSLSNAIPTARRPYLYPVNGPDGISLTELGKPHDPTGSHAHHYSFWIAHANVGGEDFWSERGGIIAHEQLSPMEDGPVFCRLGQKTRWLFGGHDRLHEQRTFTFYTAAPDFRIIDVDLEFTPPGNEPVVLEKTTFGFLAVRIAQSMTPFDGGGEIVNSHGDRNEQNVHLKPADWLDLSGPIAPGKWGGLAILDSPQNPGHPTLWHCRNDGWACPSFNGAASYTIQPGSALHLRYRICLHRGNAERAQVSARYAEYTTAANVHVGKVRVMESDR